jgi:hypothetical protein
MAIGMTCGGFGMGGIAQGLRMLVPIARETQGLQMVGLDCERGRASFSLGMYLSYAVAVILLRLDRPRRREAARWHYHKVTKSTASTKATSAKTAKTSD